MRDVRADLACAHLEWWSPQARCYLSLPPGTAAETLKPHSCALERPILQSDMFGAWTVPTTSGFSVSTNTARPSSMIANAPRLKTSLMPPPMHGPQWPIPFPWHVETGRTGWLVARVPLTETPEGMRRTALQSRLPIQSFRSLVRQNENDPHPASKQPLDHNQRERFTLARSTS
jgi:hypothetical protein